MSMNPHWLSYSISVIQKGNKKYKEIVKLDKHWIEKRRNFKLKFWQSQDSKISKACLYSFPCHLKTVYCNITSPQIFLLSSQSSSEAPFVSLLWKWLLWQWEELHVVTKPKLKEDHGPLKRIPPSKTMSRNTVLVVIGLPYLIKQVYI